MKKALLLIVGIISVVLASAQEKNTTISQPETISIDSLSMKLEKLQHDYDFLNCCYSIDEIAMDLEMLAHSIDIHSNELMINRFHLGYNGEYYNLLEDYYDSCRDRLDIAKKRFEAVQNNVLLKIMTSSFTESEIATLYSSLKRIPAGISVVKSSLESFKFTKQFYREKR